MGTLFLIGFILFVAFICIVGRNDPDAAEGCAILVIGGGFLFFLMYLKYR